MNILIVGNGGREHALTWKVSQSPLTQHIFVAPGNPGTASVTKAQNVMIATTDIDALVSFAKAQLIDLCIVGPEVPLSLGLCDRLRQHHIACIGPNKNASQLESSKAFCKDFLIRHHIPTARYQTYDDANLAKQFIRENPASWVIKADGLAAGKGVIIAHDTIAAELAIDTLQPHRLVIEEFLVGEEVSFICLVDGEHALPLATSQDHKTRDDGDQGPNTGGMGAYSPAPIVTHALQQSILDDIIYPTIRGMQHEDRPFSGFLYAGLMIDHQGKPQVLEFNCRLGDPETQPLLMRLQSDLVELCIACVEQRLDQVDCRWDPRIALGVVMCAAGYPDQYRKNDVIDGLDLLIASNSLQVFQAGTQQNDAGQIVTCGGRVLCVTALGKTVKSAQQTTYAACEKIHWEGAFYRKDIGHRALTKLMSN